MVNRWILNSTCQTFKNKFISNVCEEKRIWMEGWYMCEQPLSSPPTLCNDVLSTSWKGDGSTRISSISIGLSISASSHALICSSQWEARWERRSRKTFPPSFQMQEFMQRGSCACVHQGPYRARTAHVYDCVCACVCAGGRTVLELCKTLKRLETACDVPVRQHWDLGRLTPCGLSLDLTYTPRIGMAEFTGHSVRMPAKAEQATALVWFLTFTLQFLQNQDFPEDKWNPEQSLYS